MNINCMSITKQKDRFMANTVSISSFRTITKQEKDYPIPIAMGSGIVQRLLAETDVSEKSL
jgi:hypothetical protein